MGHMEGNRYSLNEILERTSEAPGVMESDDPKVLCPISELFFKWKVAGCLPWQTEEVWRMVMVKIKSSVYLSSQSSNWWRLGRKFFTIYSQYSKKMTDWLVKHGVAVQEEWWGEIKKATKNKSSEAGTINQLLEWEAVGEGHSIWAGSCPHRHSILSRTLKVFGTAQGFVLAIRKNCMCNVKPLQCPLLNVSDSLGGVGRFQLGTRFCYVEV